MSEDTKKSTIEAEVVEKKHTHSNKTEHDHTHSDHTHSDKTHTHEKQEKSDDIKFTFNKFTETVDKFVNKQLPSLPENVKEFLVKIIPYLSIIGLVFYGFIIIFILIALPILLITGQIGAFISAILSVGTFVLSIMAIPGLFNRQKKGWTYNYYAFLIGLVGSLFAGSFGGLIIGGAIGTYFIFQLRSYYK